MDLQTRQKSILASEAAAIDYMRKKRNKVPLDYGESSRKKNFKHHELIAKLPTEIVIIDDDEDVVDNGPIVRNIVTNDQVNMNGPQVIDMEADANINIEMENHVAGMNVENEPEMNDANGEYGSASNQPHEIVVHVQQLEIDASDQPDERGAAGTQQREIGVQTEPQIGIIEAAFQDLAGESDQYTQTDGTLCFLKHEEELSAAHSTVIKLKDRIGSEPIMDSKQNDYEYEAAMEVSFEEDRFSDVEDEFKQYDTQFARGYGFTSNVGSTNNA